MSLVKGASLPLCLCLCEWYSLLSRHLADERLVVKWWIEELFDKVSEGDVDSFNKGLQGMMRQVYKTAIEDSNRLMDARFAKFQDELMGKLNTSKEADNMLSELKAAIPFAKDPAVEPVARQILSGYLRQGMSKSEAIGATNAYFNRLADTVGQKDKPESKTSGIKYGRESWDELFNN